MVKLDVDLSQLSQRQLLKLVRAAAKAYNNNASIVDGHLKVKVVE